jgi:hypothetical protein
VARFGRDRMIGEYLDAYDGLLDRPRRPGTPVVP